MNVTNYYGNLIIEDDSKEIYIRCFNHIHQELKKCLSDKIDSEIECFLGDLMENGENQYDTLKISFEPKLSLSMSDEILIVENNHKEYVISEILKYLD